VGEEEEGGGAGKEEEAAGLAGCASASVAVSGETRTLVLSSPDASASADTRIADTAPPRGPWLCVGGGWGVGVGA
jgi:hypothetical protein